MLKHRLRAKCESTSATSAAVPTTMGMDTVGALLRSGSSCTLVQALVNGAIRPSSVTLRAPMCVMLGVQQCVMQSTRACPCLEKHLEPHCFSSPVLQWQPCAS